MSDAGRLTRRHTECQQNTRLTNGRTATMNAPVTSLAARRQQEDLAWRDAAGVADYLIAHLNGDKEAKAAVIADAKELAKLGESALKDELDALRTRRYADAA